MVESYRYLIRGGARLSSYGGQLYKISMLSMGVNFRVPIAFYPKLYRKIMYNHGHFENEWGHSLHVDPPVLNSSRQTWKFLV